MKKILFILLIMMSSILKSEEMSLFGLKGNIQIDQINKILGKENLVECENDFYNFTTKFSNKFGMKAVMLEVPKDKGLVRIIAVSLDKKTDKYGTQCKKEYKRIQTELKKKYGNVGKERDKLNICSIYKDDDEYMLGIMWNHRLLQSYWYTYNRKDNLRFVVELMQSEQVGTFYNMYVYVFKNYEYRKYTFDNEESEQTLFPY